MTGWQGNLYLYQNDQLAKILANYRHLIRER
jgi:hypothetical protein